MRTKSVFLHSLRRSLNFHHGKVHLSTCPNITFSNGVKIPVIGLGTWKSEPAEVTEAVKHAIDVGYRHIDCAHIYQNECEVGQAIREKIEEGVIKREDLFITSKLWNTFHRPEDVEEGLQKTLDDLGLEYVDLYLMHWPFALKEGCDLFPRDHQDRPYFTNVDYLDTWQAMEQLYKDDLVKSIGVSNFNIKQIKRLLFQSTVAPVTNQIECNPYLTQKELTAFCQDLGIVITAFSPLGSSGSAGRNLMEEPTLANISKKYRKTPAQILIRYHVERGHITIPKSVRNSRIEENFNVLDFYLEQKDVKLLNALNQNRRSISYIEAAKHKYYPFVTEFC